MQKIFDLKWASYCFEIFEMGWHNKNHLERERNLMRNLLTTVLMFVCLGASWARADFIDYQISGDIVLDVGSDTLGLDGASFTLTASFDSDAVYQDFFGFPAVASISDSLVITGASNASTNGTYSEDFGLVFYPTFNGTLFGGASGGEFAGWTINGELVNSGFFAEPTAVVQVGDTISPDDFSLIESTTTGTPDFSVFSTGASYNIANFEASVSTIPEPGFVGLIVTFATAGCYRRRR